jgi:hypothetical protein
LLIKVGDGAYTFEFAPAEATVGVLEGGHACPLDEHDQDDLATNGHRF